MDTESYKYRSEFNSVLFPLLDISIVSPPAGKKNNPSAPIEEEPDNNSILINPATKFLLVTYDGRVILKAV